MKTEKTEGRLRRVKTAKGVGYKAESKVRGRGGVGRGGSGLGMGEPTYTVVASSIAV